MTSINPSFNNNQVRMLKTTIQPKEVEQTSEEIQKVTEEAAKTEQTAKPGMGDADTSQYLANMGIKIEKLSVDKPKAKVELNDESKELSSELKEETNADDEEPVMLKGIGRGLRKLAGKIVRKAKKIWNQIKSAYEADYDLHLQNTEAAAVGSVVERHDNKNGKK